MRLVNEETYGEYGKSRNVMYDRLKSVGPFKSLTVSQGKNNHRLVDLFSDLDTLFDIDTQGLFAEYAKAASGTLDCDFGVHPVLNADDDREWCSTKWKHTRSGGSERCRTCIRGG